MFDATRGIRHWRISANI